MAVGDSPAKLTKDAKAMIQLAFEDLGGLPRLVEWANASQQNLGDFYKTIWCKIIPKDIKAEVDGNITIEIVKYGDSTYAIQDQPHKEKMIIHDVIESAILLDDNEDD
jgi:hypothetical protein